MFHLLFLTEAHTLLPHDDLPPVSVSRVSSPYGTPVMLDWEPTLLEYDLLLTNHTCNDRISKYGHIWKCWGLGLQHIFWGDTIQLVIGSSGLWQFLQLFLLLMTLHLRHIGQVFLEYLSNGIFLVMFLMIRLGLWDLGRKKKHKSAVPLSSQPIKVTYHQCDLLLLILTVISWLK